jgi:hypothetical protein
MLFVMLEPPHPISHLYCWLLLVLLLVILLDEGGLVVLGVERLPSEGVMFEWTPIRLVARKRE